MAALLIVFVIGEGWNYYLVRSIHIVESYKVGSSAELSETLTAGPLRGIVTIPEISRKYDAALSDMDLIKKETDGFFYVEGECPWYYLYVDHPYGTYTTYYVGSDSHAKTLRYWKLFPEKRPSCIYVPFFETSDYKTDLKRAQKELRYFKSLCDFEITEGKAGYILKNISWK